MTGERLDLGFLRIAAPEDVRPAAIAFREAAEALASLRVAAHHNIALKTPMLDHEGKILATEVFGWTTETCDRWWQSPRLALDSPLPTACRYESEPFWCNSDGFWSHHHNKFLDAIDLSDFEERALTFAAIVIPVHLPFGQVGAVSFSPRDRAQRDMSGMFRAFGDLLGAYARTFVGNYVRVMCPNRRLPTGLRLSKREVECLRWAAFGKTDDEISLIMSRSRATVRFHIHNASLKLDAVNRSQTLFKAAQLGYIGLAS